MARVHPPVDKIVDRERLRHRCETTPSMARWQIDALAGPSEIVVVADAQSNPEWIAADLLSSGEHDPAAQSI